MPSTALVSDDTSFDWKIARKGGGAVACESVHATSVIRIDLCDASPLPVGFGLLSDLIAELSDAPEVADARVAIAAEQRAIGANNLATLRMEKGLSQKQLGDAIGTSQAAISRLESGTQEPLISTLRKLSEALEVDLNTIDAAFPRG